MAFMVLFTDLSLMIPPSQLLLLRKQGRMLGVLVVSIFTALSAVAQDCADPAACNYNPNYVEADTAS